MTNTREERLRIVARGKCSAVSRMFGVRIKWLPAVDRRIAQLSEEEDDCDVTTCFCAEQAQSPSRRIRNRRAAPSSLA